MPRPSKLMLSWLFGFLCFGVYADSKVHWAFRELRQVSLPAITNTGLVRNPIDTFIVAKLESHGLTPSPEADHRTLLRRASFDLTGLPPSSSELESSDRFESVVARLLNSPAYGEKWARHWLDVVHYADTHGNDHDYARFNAWPYRDYVIRAFNTDKPYSRFIQEQIAGDVLYPSEPEATIALGFLAAGPWDDTLMVTVREDTFDHRMSKVLDRDNMVTTVMSTFQSLTVHCARCHDHKFDPVSQREYYGLQAVFAGIDRADRPYDDDPATHLKRGKLLERKRAIAAREQSILDLLDEPETVAKVDALAAELTAWREAWQPLDAISVANASGNANVQFAREADGSWFVSGARPDKDTYIVTARNTLTNIAALRLEVLPDERLSKNGPGRFENGNFHLSEVRAWVQPTLGAVQPLSFARATVDHSGDGQGGPGLIDGKPETYWSVHPRYGESHDAFLELKDLVTNAVTLVIRLEHEEMAGHQIGRFRLFASARPESRPSIPAAIVAQLSVPSSERTREQQVEVALFALGAHVDRALAELPPPRMVYAATRDFAPSGSFKPSLKPRPIHRLIRGDLNRPSELISPSTLSCVPGLSGELSCAGGEDDEGSRRAALAHWITDPRNVLTWRSIVNRVWHYHFGRGLVDTPNDFGRMGSTPSHPELLDWLALWFRDEARGSLKALHHLILTSATWRQSSQTRQGQTIDSDNRLLWRQNRGRLTAEEMRDTMLFLSGRLDPTMGGPAAIQFIHRDKATFNTDGAPAFLDYENFDPDSAPARRRSVYRFLFRTVPDPLMDALDCPDGGTITPVRSVSTTVLQALATLNDGFLIRQCEHLATRVSRAHNRAEDQVRSLYRFMLQREPTPEESSKLEGYTRKHGLANTCHLLMNSNEFLYLD